MYEQFYINPASVPDIFRQADRIMEKRFPKENRYTPPKKIPMPYIDSNPNVKGPIYYTKDWFWKSARKTMTEKGETRRDVHIKLMKLLAEKDMLRLKLAKLDPSKKRDSKKIVKINIRLKDIDAEMEMHNHLYNIDVKELDKGTKFQRKLEGIKKKLRKGLKKIKSFVKDNLSFISEMAAIVVPVIGGLVIKKTVTKSKG